MLETKESKVPQNSCCVSVAIESGTALTDMHTLVHNKYQIKLYQIEDISCAGERHQKVGVDFEL